MTPPLSAREQEREKIAQLLVASLPHHSFADALDGMGEDWSTEIAVYLMLHGVSLSGGSAREGAPQVIEWPAFFGSIWDTLVEAPPYDRQYFTRQAFIENVMQKMHRAGLVAAPSSVSREGALEEAAKIIEEERLIDPQTDYDLRINVVVERCAKWIRALKVSGGSGE